jgi:tryptophanyl-tRNA synthetase
MSKKILVTGVKPTGQLHIGNYFGAIKQALTYQDQFECKIFIADMHALTSFTTKEELHKNILDIAIDYVALGLDLEKTLFYQQSAAPQVAELTWYFNCITTMPYLMRAHAFKDAETKNKEINAGVFEYPLLMAADVLLPFADVVPVGFDQKQHIEIARDTAEKSNRIFGTKFKLPEAIILEEVKTVPGTDGRKMSKSYGNTIPLFAEDDEIKKAVMSIKTDSKGVEEKKDPETCNVFAIHKLFANTKEEKQDLETLANRYREGGIGYKESKDLLVEKVKAFITPIREKRKRISESREETEKVVALLKANDKKAYADFEEKMVEVRKAIGLVL